MWSYSFMKNMLHPRPLVIKCVRSEILGYSLPLLFFMLEDDWSDVLCLPMYGAVRGLQSDNQIQSCWQELTILYPGRPPPLCSSLLPHADIMCLAPHLVLLCGIIQWRNVVGPMGMGNCTYQTYSLLVLIAEEAEGLMVLGAKALIPDLPLDSLELLGNFHHTA